MYTHMKDVTIVLIVATSFITILGYVVHMFIGGLVGETTEKIAILLVCSTGLAIVILLSLDIINQRRKR